MTIAEELAELDKKICEMQKMHHEQLESLNELKEMYSCMKDIRDALVKTLELKIEVDAAINAIANGEVEGDYVEF